MKKISPHTQQGFFLLGLAFILVLVAVLLVGYLQVTQSKKMYQNAEETTQRLDAIQKALIQYRGMNLKFPCPARRDIGPDDPTFGRKTDCSIKTVIPGQCLNGYCVQKSTSGPRVRIGLVPVRELNLSDDAALDGWGNQILYALTEDLATSVTAAGGIGIVDESGASLVTPAGTAYYLLLSHGPDRKGGADPCGSTGLDVQNCIPIDATTLPITPEFRLTNYFQRDGAKHFDDRLVYGTAQSPMCQPKHVMWGAYNCSGDLPSASDGAANTLSFSYTDPATSTKYTGTANYTCYAGSWIKGATTCVKTAAICDPYATTVLGTSCSVEGEQGTEVTFCGGVYSASSTPEQCSHWLTCSGGKWVETKSHCTAFGYTTYTSVSPPPGYPPVKWTN